eukprot:COSAG03_NODE_23386_length_280_cov_0.939227_1_plen_39_part_01
MPGHDVLYALFLVSQHRANENEKTLNRIDDYIREAQDEL